MKTTQKVFFLIPSLHGLYHFDENNKNLTVSVNDYTALEVVEGCDVVIDALDSVNARYALNKACVKFGIPFVTGAAVGTSGQAFTILPKESACYYCMFPALDEDTMPTCSIEGVHPSILSIMGGIEVAEAVKVITGTCSCCKVAILFSSVVILFNKSLKFKSNSSMLLA